MAIRDRLANWIVGKQPSVKYSLTDFPIPPKRNLDQYLQIYGQVGWLYGCVSRIASAVSDTKWHLYQIQGDKQEEVINHPLMAMLDYVNPFYTGQELMELSQMYLDLTGESWWILNRNRMGIPVEIWPVPPSRMRIVPSREDFIAGYVYELGGQRVPFEISDVIFTKYPNPHDMYRGISPAQSIASDIDAELYSSQWNRNFFYNDASPGLVLSYPDRMPPDEYERLKEQWNQNHQGVARAHKMAIITGGGKIERTAMSQRDMDFWKLRKLNRDVILGAYGVPLSVMGISENVNRANAESGEYVFARWVIKPRLTRIREKLNEQLVPMFGDNLSLEFEDPVPENREQLLGEAERGFKAGFVTRNEARAILGYDEVKTGDVFLIPFNMVPQPIKGHNGHQQEIPWLPVGKSFTDEQKETAWRIFAAKTETQERPFRKLVKTLFEEQAKEVIGNLQGGNRTPDSVIFDEEKAIKRFKDAFLPLIEDVYTESAETALKQPDDFLDEDALKWIEERSLLMAKMVNGTTKEQLRPLIAEGFRLGESMEDITRRIKDFYKNGYEYRAPMVARTEVIAASNEGALWRYGREGVKETEFYPAADACPECEALVGVYPVKEATGVIPVHPQ